jgi:glucose/mannose-6-phosphate isomerase
LLNKKILQKYDPENMHQVYDKWPDLALTAYESQIHTLHTDNPNHIVFAGMGGSGTIGDIIKALLSKTPFHVSVVKGYSLPNTVNSKTLVVATSVSGNTDETITVLKSAKKKGSQIVAISSGGKFEEYCKKNRILFQKIDMVHSPRASLPIFLYSTLKLLRISLNLSSSDIYESIRKLGYVKKQIYSQNINEHNSSFQLANWITGIPLIYYPAGLQAAAIRFKNSLQENSKRHVFAEDVIEACHNSIVPWEKRSNVQPLLIRGTNDHPKTKERWELIKEYFDKQNIQNKEITSVNGSILTKIMCLIYLLDYASIYLAILNKINPTPVEPISFIKNGLSKR